MSALYVLFRVAETEYVLPAADVLQMESFNGATYVPGAPGYVAGLMQIRGRVVPVVDLRLRFGLPSLPPTLDSRVVVMQHEDRTVALLVDQAREVLRLDPSKFRAPPDVVQDESKGFVKWVAQAGNRIVLLIDPSRVIGEEKLDGQQRSVE